MPYKDYAKKLERGRERERQKKLEDPTYKQRRIDGVKNWREKNKGQTQKNNRKWREVHPGYKPAVRNLRHNVKLHYGCCNPQCHWQGPYHHSMLDYHHVDPTKKVRNVASCGTMADIISEINLCTVLCACCHRLVHHGDLDCSTFKVCKIKQQSDYIPVCTPVSK